jgi:ribosome biogenesis ATPase
MIDPAMCRPGRLDKLLFVDLPNAQERVDIFMALVRKLPIRDDQETRLVVLKLVKGESFDGFSGADLAALVREAGVIALRRTITNWETSIQTQTATQNDIKVTVDHRDFQSASTKVGPSVSKAQRRKYESLRAKFSGAVPIVKTSEDINDA